MRIGGILETCLYVDDLEAAQQFYTQVLGLQVVERHPTRHLFLRCGEQMLLIFDATESSAETNSLPLHGAHGPGHVAFSAADSEVVQWTQQLRDKGVEIERTVAWPQGGHSVYFRDPDGNSLEIASPQIWALPKETG